MIQEVVSVIVIQISAEDRSIAQVVALVQRSLSPGKSAIDFTSAVQHKTISS
jgi:hypothetical protein